MRIGLLAVWLVASNVAAAYLIRWALSSLLGRDVGVTPILACIFFLPLLVRRTRAQPPREESREIRAIR